MSKDFLQTLKRAQHLFKNSQWSKDLDCQEIQLKIIQKLYKKYNLDLHLTCMAFPESYDIFQKGKQVGYIRLRHGSLSLEYPDIDGELLYKTESVFGDGMFHKDERFNYMSKLLHILNNKLLDYL